MKPIRTAITLAALTVAIQAHAGLFSDEGMSKSCPQEHSKAWCVWDAAKMSKDTSDIPQKSFRANYEKNNSGIVDLGLALATDQGWIRPTRDPLGLSKGTQAGMWFLGFLLAGPRATSNGNRVLGWMPIEMARTQEEAGRRFNELIVKAAAKSMPGYTMTPAVLPFSKDDYKSLNGRFAAGWSVTGKDCDQVTCQVIRYANASVDGEFYDGRPSEGEAPQWMGGYKAWVFDVRRSALMPVLLVGDKEYMTQKIAVELSKNLPSWAFISIADQHETLGRVANRGISLPMVINEGKLYAPIFPEVDLKIPENATAGASNE